MKEVSVILSNSTILYIFYIFCVSSTAAEVGAENYNAIGAVMQC